MNLGWVKEHARIKENEEADKGVGWCTNYIGESSATEGGIRAFWKALRRTENVYDSFGKGQVVV